MYVCAECFDFVLVFSFTCFAYRVDWKHYSIIFMDQNHSLMIRMKWVNLFGSQTLVSYAHAYTSCYSEFYSKITWLINEHKHRQQKGLSEMNCHSYNWTIRKNHDGNYYFTHSSVLRPNGFTGTKFSTKK